MSPTRPGSDGPANGGMRCDRPSGPAPIPKRSPAEDFLHHLAPKVAGPPPRTVTGPAVSSASSGPIDPGGEDPAGGGRTSRVGLGEFSKGMSKRGPPIV